MVDHVSGMPSCQGEEMTACQLSCVALQTKTDELDTILCLTPEGVMALDGELRIRYVNQAFSRLTGLLPQHLLGLDEASFWQMLSEVNRAEVPDQAANPDHWLLNIQTPIRRILDVQRVQGQGLSKSISAVLCFRDATREIELQQLTNRFLSTAAHELRAPLASVFGFAEALLTQDFDPESQREFIGIIHQESARMTNLLNEMLDLARIEARGVQDLALVRMPVMVLLRQTLQGFKPPNGRAAPVVVSVQEPETCVSVDPAKLQQAILNVLSNAYKYSPQGGEVSVELTIDAQGSERPMAGIRICDQGIGMTTTQIGHIFDRFYRVHHNSQIPGTGLGMSIVKEILELHGGHVQVHSLPGQGTRIELWIPMDQPVSH